MNAAALYLRSSKDRSDVSIDAQRRALTQLAQERGLLVAREYVDTVESGKDEDRPGFKALIADLKNRSRGWSTLILLDTSRLARRRHISIIFEHEAEKHNIRIVYKSIPDDTDPITTMLLKSILQAMDEWHSLTSRQKGISGMAENVRKGFRAGGRAPKGYRLVKVTTGAVRDGEDVTKSKLEPDENAAVVGKYLSLRARGTPRSRAAGEAGIEAPATSLIGMERNALTYAGHTVWNVHNEFSKGGYKGGQKRRPRSEWVIQRDTHKALISEGEAELILSELESVSRNYGRVNTPYLLTGLLRSPDGKAWEGSGDGYYRLRASGRRGKYVRAADVEEAVLSQVRSDARSIQFVNRLVMAARSRQPQPDESKALQREVVTINGQISRMMELAAEMSSAGPALRKVEELEGKRQRVVAQLAQIERDRAADAALSGITEEQVSRILEDRLSDEQPENRRSILDSLVERITLDPETLECRIEYRIEYRAKLASPRGFEFSPVLRALTVIGLK